MEQQQDPGKSLFELNLDASNSYALRSAASWAKVLGVVGMIVGIIITLLFIYMLGRPLETDAYGYREEGFGRTLSNDPAEAKLGFWVFIIVGVIFFFGGFFSFRFGNKMNMSLKSNDQGGLDKAFGWLRNYFAFRSIIIIIVLLMFLLMASSLIMAGK